MTKTDAIATLVTSDLPPTVSEVDTVGGDSEASRFFSLLAKFSLLKLCQT